MKVEREASGSPPVLGGPDLQIAPHSDALPMGRSEGSPPVPGGPGPRTSRPETRGNRC